MTSNLLYTIIRNRLCFSICSLLLLSQSIESNQNETVPQYTSKDDVSWAISSRTLSTLLGEDKQALYDRYIEECTAASQLTDTPSDCKVQENFRLQMNTQQPSSVRNYTSTGYQKIRAPKELFDLIRNFYDDNKGNDETEWKEINTYHNMWEVPPTIMLMNQDRFSGGGRELQSEVWKVAKRIMEEWSGQKLKPVSLYGIRLYHNRSILAPHVDRFPLVISAIINVDQEVDEPWPLEVYGHDGKATNVTMEPGDMVLYESHSVIHGRPFPLNGNFYANVFVHFEPIGFLDPNIESQYDPELDLPPYLIPGSKWAADWQRKNPRGWKLKAPMNSRRAAQNGKVDFLKQQAEKDPSAFLLRDDLGWTPFHEAVRSGNIESVQIIIDALGANKVKNLLTYTGVTPLDIAKEFLEKGNPVTTLLKRFGAVENLSNDKGEL